MNKRRSGTCLSKCFPIIVTLFDIISHRHFCSDSDVFLHRFKYWFVFVGYVTLVNKHSQTFLPCFNIFPTALRSLYSWQFIHIYTLALRWKSAALNVSAEENGLRDATKHSFGSQQFLYVVRPSQTINFLVYFDFFHVLSFPISSHSLERYCVSFTIMMIRAPPASVQDGQSSEWKTALWSYRRIKRVISCCSLGS